MAKRYYVHFPEDEPPIYEPKAKSLKSAKDYARIGSQYGGKRIVTRGIHGKMIRVYVKGERVWPVTRRQLQGFLESEVPRRL